MIEFTKQEQLKIIKEVEEKYSKFLDPNFDASIFLECRDNFALTSHIESVKIFEMDNPPSNPTFTIAIPTYNRCETLKEAINSVLTQETDEHYEIIVVENTNDPDIKTKIQKMLEEEYRGKLTYYKNQYNLGAYANFNRCLTLAKGHWVCILHDDDILLPSYLTHMTKAIKKRPKSILIGNLMHQDNSFFKKLYSKIFKMDNMFFELPIRRPPPSALLHHKTQCIRVGGYNGDFFPSDDMFFVCRCRKYGEIYTYREKLHTKRMEIATESQPKTQLEFCYIDIAFFQFYITPQIVFNILARQQLINYANTLIKNKNFIVAERIMELLKQKKCEDISYIKKNLIKFFYIATRYFKNI